MSYGLCSRHQLGRNTNEDCWRLEHLKKLVILGICLSLLVAFAAVAGADTFDNVLQRWTKSQKYIDRDDNISNLEIRATYYSAEFIEAYVQSQAKQNLWTQQEMDDYKYNFLKALRLNEMIPIQIKFINNAETMYLGPFDSMAKLRVGNQLYKPVDYDKRFNFRFQGEKEGLIYFRRFDEKTGKDLLKGAKSATLELSPNINPTITRGATTKMVWDIADDNPQKLYQGKAAAQFETDRLLQRLDKLKKDETALQTQLKSVEDEKNTIQKRLDELAKQ